MLIATLHHIENTEIVRYCGVATGSTVKGINIVKDFMSVFTDVFGGKSGSYTKAASEAEQEAISALQVKAVEMGGNAVLGVRVEHVFAPNKSGMMMVNATGTVVVLTQPSEGG